MKNADDAPSSSQMDPAEGSREVIERELRRKYPEKDSTGEHGKAPDGKKPSGGHQPTDDVKTRDSAIRSK
jgi:hypothetical protein